MPIHAGDSVEVRYTHSLNLSPVIDVIEWDGENLIVRKTIYKTFGGGIPIPSDGIGTELRHTDGRYELIGINKSLNKSFTIMTQTIPNHEIYFKDHQFSLLELVGSGQVVKIEVKPIPRIQRLLLGCI